MKSILFISPRFFDYYLDISRELSSSGYNVIWFDDRPSNSLISKSLIRLRKKSQKKEIDKYFNKILFNTSNMSISFIIIILGQSFTKENIEALRFAHKEAKIIYYTWDSIANFPDSLQLAQHSDSAFSFDDSDCKKYNLKFLPLFFLPNKATHSERLNYMFSSIMTIKPGKLSEYKKIIAKIPSCYQSSSFTYLYLQSRLVFFFYKIKFPEFRHASINQFKYKPLTRDSCDQIMSNSKIIIDCQMKNQIGLTMRTFEALSKRKKLITTNESIKNYSFYSSNNIFIVNEKSSTIPLSFFDSDFDTSYSLPNSYSISFFVNKLLND